MINCGGAVAYYIILYAIASSNPEACILDSSPENRRVYIPR